MESIAKRILRLRTAKGWKRPELGRRMAKAINREKPFTGELIRKYETGENNPSNEAREALSAVFDVSEAYIEFGTNEAPAVAPKANGSSSIDDPRITKLITMFGWLTDEQQTALLKQLVADAETNKAISRELGARWEFKSDKRVGKFYQPAPKGKGRIR